MAFIYSIEFYIFHSLPIWSCGFNLQLVQLVGRFWVFFHSHSPGRLGRPAGKVAQVPCHPLVPLYLWRWGRGTVGAGQPPSVTAPGSSTPQIQGLREPDLLPRSPSSWCPPLQGHSCEGAIPMGTPGCNLALTRFGGASRPSHCATTGVGFSCGFISTSSCGSSTAVCSWGFPGGLGFAPVRAWCGGGAAAWVAAFLAAPGTQGSWGLGQQEIQCSRRAWQPVLANTL